MNLNLFLDSGAFTVWRQGGEVNLQDYIDFIHTYKEHFTVYVNLDVMKDPVKTWENQREMERQGLTPLPVYHIGEPEKYFKMCMEYEYFGVGGNVQKGMTGLYKHYDHLFSKICLKENNYIPNRKLHALGVTIPLLLVTYPWYSSDSTSWVMYGKYGMIILPRFESGKPVFTKAPWTLAVSTKSKARQEIDAHIDTISGMMLDSVLSYIEEKGFHLGENEYKYVDEWYKPKENESWYDRGRRLVEVRVKSGLINDHRQRDFFNLLFYLDLEKNLPQWPWPWKSSVGSLF